MKLVKETDNLQNKQHQVSDEKQKKQSKLLSNGLGKTPIEKALNQLLKE